jgi:hypothetical protein
MMDVPLEASGLQLQDRLTQIHDSIARVEQKKSLPPALKHLQQILTKGLQRTAVLWAPIKDAYEQVYQAAHILANHGQQTGA